MSPDEMQHAAFKAEADANRRLEARVKRLMAELEASEAQLREVLVHADKTCARPGDTCIPRSTIRGEVTRMTPLGTEPTSGHSIAWTIETDWIDGVITCHEEPGAICRKTCDGDCETWYVCEEGSILDDGQKWCHECEKALPEGSEHCTGGHLIGPREACSLADGIGDVEIAECYVGPKVPLVPGVIDAWWDDDGLHWSYREPAAEVPA